MKYEVDISKLITFPMFLHVVSFPNYDTSFNGTVETPAEMADALTRCHIGHSFDAEGSIISYHGFKAKEIYLNGETCLEFKEAAPEKIAEPIDLETLYERYTDWSVGTFGMDTPVHGLTKLIKEANEAIKEPHDIVEYADCLQCLLYAFKCAFPDKPISELLEAVELKLNVNIKRQWVKQPDGTWQHA